MAAHLRMDELIDLADKTRERATAPHLDVCRDCVRALEALEQAMSAAGEWDVPEPSPLFWDHLSARVREAVRAEGEPTPGFWPSLLGGWRIGRAPGVVYAVAAGAVLVLLVFLRGQGGQSGVPASPGTGAAVVSAALAPEGAVGDELPEDPSLTLVADLTAGMSGDTAWTLVQDAGLATEGSAEHAVTHLTETELRQLYRLLERELARPGA